MFEDVIVAGGPIAPTPSAEVDEAEARLGIRFPSGYREFVTRFGEGLLGSYIRIYPPRRILSGENNLVEWRQRIDEYWFWDAFGHTRPDVVLTHEGVPLVTLYSRKPR